MAGPRPCDILRAERKRAGLTQDAMAAALKISQPHYSKLERGEVRYNVVYLVLAKRRLGVSYDVLTGEKRGDGECRESR